MITEITSGYFIIEIFKFAFQNMCICSSQALTNLLYKSTLKLLEFAFLVWLTSLVTMARGLLPFPWGDTAQLMFITPSQLLINL